MGEALSKLSWDIALTGVTLPLFVMAIFLYLYVRNLRYYEGRS
jgi:hypothetical protein